MLKKNLIEKLALLSRIRLEKEEKDNIPGELDSILNYIQKLSDVNTENREPLFHFPELKNVAREDKPEEADEETKRKMMAMGKDKDHYLKVESIL